ncbi:MAG: hypothetical protein RLZZ546_748 [Bacteroidota bacterium]|jgi:hypothetical protein
MERKIILTPELIKKLSLLINNLHNEKYFGTKKLSQNYVNKIFNFIEKIGNQKKYLCINSKHGSFYCKLVMNRKTTYYITFDQEDDNFLIKNFFTNHESGYTKYIK